MCHLVEIYAVVSDKCFRREIVSGQPDSVTLPISSTLIALGGGQSVDKYSC